MNNDSDSYTAKKSFYDRVLTVYGRKPALEALRDRDLECHALHLAHSNKAGGIVGELLTAAAEREVPVKRHTREELSRISKNGKQDQGVALDIVCGAFGSLENYLLSVSSLPPQRLLALDSISNPQNLGMIIRSAAAGNIDGIIWSSKGNAALGPLVIKASVGTLYRAPMLSCASLPEALADCQRKGIEVCTLAADAPLTLFEHQPTGHCIYVLGNETSGVSPKVAALSDQALSIPMNNGVESLNVAVTASLIAFAPGLTGNHLDR